MKIKAILTIFVSLVLGFILGFLVSGQIRKQEINKKHSHSYHEMFIYRTLGVVKPSEVQKDTILPVVEEYAVKALDLKNKVGNEFDSLMYKMNQDLRPFITDEQFRRLEENANRLKQRKSH